MDEAWDKEIDRLVDLVRKNKIEYDPTYVIINTDGLNQIIRADMLPIFTDNVLFTLEVL